MNRRTATSIASRLLSVLAWGIVAVWGIAILWVACVMVDVIGWKFNKWWVESVFESSWREWGGAGLAFVVIGVVLCGIVATTMWALNRVTEGRLLR
jgi:hypothetical protein